MRHISSAALDLIKSRDISEDPKNSELCEKDACGIGAVVNRIGTANRMVVETVMAGLCDMDLRGAKIDGTGDGAGVMFRTRGMRKFFEQFVPLGTHVEDTDEIYAGNFFVNRDDSVNLPTILAQINDILIGPDVGVKPLAWRTSIHSAPGNSFGINPKVLGIRAKETMPIIAQLLFTKGFKDPKTLVEALHQGKHVISSQMKMVETVSLEKGTITYKAMATGAQLQRFYRDFRHPHFKSDAGLFHVRFATNVLSRWILAQLFRLLGHNGEINTIAAQRNAIRNLEKALRLADVLMKNGSDSADLDRLTELFHAYGVPLGESLRRFLQPTPDDQKLMDKDVRLYHQAARRALGPLSAVEGPAGIVAMDEEEVIGILDGLGHRPLRVIETTDNMIIITSEIGAPPIPLNKIKRTFQLDAGEMVSIKKDGRVLYPGEADQDITSRTELNFEEIALGMEGDRKKIIILPVTREQEEKEALDQEEIIAKWNLFGGNSKLHRLLTNMALDGKEPVIGMGNDKPLAVFSRRNPRFAQYFHQIVAVVTNPPMDPIREGASMNLRTYIGRRPKASVHGHEYKIQPFIELESPILTEEQFQNLIELDARSGISIHRMETNFNGKNGANANTWIEDMKQRAVKIAHDEKHSIIILSDRGIHNNQIYIPPALIAAVIHNELSKLGLRRNVSIVCDTGEAFESHDVALLIAMGADAVNPYLAWQTVDSGIIQDPEKKKDAETLKKNIMATYTAMLKRVMSKMGITSIEGYRGSKLMQAVGIVPELLQYYMQCPGSNLSGATLEDIIQDIITRSLRKDKIFDEEDKGAYAADIRKILEAAGGWKTQTPEEAYGLFLDLVEKQKRENPVFLRDLLEIKENKHGTVPFGEVMPQDQIFSEGIIVGTAMSVGALQNTAHRAISGAFNELGGMSNTGEGGFPRDRNPGGPLEKDNCKIRQRASAMFGQNAEYFAFAEEIEIKVGQGAKPGEGGHLQYFKVDGFIAKMRGTMPGTDLISPPPLHDVYSIEDLTRLIQDLRAVNPKARIAVKITANTDIGTVAVGVAKAGADIISLSGFEGGTGAAMQSSIEHTGLPLEESLADVHQALTRNGIRDLVKIRVDGGIKTGEDIIKLACLGADAFALGTALLIAGERCIFCHSCSASAKGKVPGTFEECPTGIMPASRLARGRLGLGAGKIDENAAMNSDDQAYRSCKAATKHYLKLLAEDVRKRLSVLGKRDIKEIVGDTTLLHQVSRTEKADRLVLDRLLKDVRVDAVKARKKAIKNHVDRTLTRPAVNAENQRLIDEVERQIAEGKSKVIVKLRLKNSARSFGATLAGKIARKEIVPPPGGIHIYTTHYAGQSFGFCAVDGMYLHHTGFGNDFISMGQSGGTVSLRQPKKQYRRDNSLGGNACAYGAQGGKLFGAGKFGQRFGVRNSGATLVSEGTGKYPYEYMTSGLGIDLGRTGNKAGAGMSGGRLFLLDEDGTLEKRLHPDVRVTQWTKRDHRKLKEILQEYHEDTKSPLAFAMLDGWGRLDQFRRVVPKDHYVNAVTQVLIYDFYRLDDSVSQETLMEDAAIELMAFLGSNEDDPRINQILEKIRDLKKTLEGDESHRKKKEPDRFQEAKQKAREFIKNLSL